MALVACGGSGGGGGVVPAEPKPVEQKPAELSLVAGTIETFNGTGAQVRITAPDGVAIDSLGNTYITQSELHLVRKISPAGVVTVFAGDAVNPGSADGTGSSARFSNPGSIAVDAADNVYVLDTGNYTVRKITPAGLVTTLAGSPGVSGAVDGKGAAAQFERLSTIAVDPAGVVFVWESIYPPKLRKIAVDGSVTTLALPPGIGGNMTADAGGNLLIASHNGVNNEKPPVLHKLTPAGVLTKVYEFTDKNSLGGWAVYVSAIVVDPAGNVYVSNNAVASLPFVSVSSGDDILKLSPLGVLTTIAGQRGQTGANDGPGLSAKFNRPGNIAADRQGNLVVADVGNNTIRAISSGGVVSTLAGRASASVDGQGDKGRFKTVVGLASDQRGKVVVAESSALRSLSPSGSLTTIKTSQSVPNLALDSRGFMYVSDASQFGPSTTTRQYTPDGVATGKTYAIADQLAVDAQDNLYGVSRGTLSNLSSEKKLAVVGVGNVSAIAFDAAGNAYLADRSRSIVFKVSPSGAVSILAGMESKPGYQDGAGATAQFNSPQGIAVVGTDVYVADTGNNLIRKIGPDGKVTTIAGTPGSLDTVMGTVGSIFRPTYITTESSNSLLVVADAKAIVRIRLQ